MTAKTSFSIAVFEGDGIGPEVTAPAVDLLNTVVDKFPDLSLSYEYLPAGAAAYQETGVALPADSVVESRKADAILLSAMGDPAVRYPDGTELVPQIELRFELGLYAGVRPVRSIPGVPSPLRDPRAANLDFVLIRESIEGLFAPGRPGTQSDTEATETMLITREVSEKLFKSTFDLAVSRKATKRPDTQNSKGRVTCVDKANVFGAFAFFREIFYEVSANYSTHDFDVDHAYVDAMAMNMLNQPWNYDVLVTENMFGDILSDLGAALIGGMGYAPSADLGDGHAVFQPCHGTAPDIVGKGLANPTAMFLSAAMMLDWLGQEHENKSAKSASAMLVQAVDNAFLEGNIRTCELGGSSGLSDVTEAVNKSLDNLDSSTF